MALSLHASGSGGDNTDAGSYTISVAVTSGDLVVLWSTISTGISTAISSITGSGVGTWTKRASASTGGGNNSEYWWAVASTTGTVTLTVTLSDTSYISANGIAFSVTGANTSTPWDTNASLPASAKDSGLSSAPSVSGVSTTNANTMIIGLVGSDSIPVPATNTAGSGFTLIISNSPGNPRILAEYKIVSATQSSITVNWGSGTLGDWVMYADAIQAPAVPQVPYTRIPQLGPIQAQ